jgi:predicted nucleic acid-binding protein
VERCARRAGKKVLRQMELAVPLLAWSQDVWETAFNIARRIREKGQTVPSSDILIFACARFHKASLIHADKHLAWLETHVL